MDFERHLVTPHNHLIGWMVIVGVEGENNIKQKINLGLNSFVGDYGLIKKTKTTNGFGVGLLISDSPLPLTTWSLYEDEDIFCFIEGTFYDDYFSHRIAYGEDRKLAKLFINNFNAFKTKAIEKLNGSFSGFIYDYKNKKLITFIDRLGVRVLYWSYEKNGIIVSSNLVAFRNLKRLSIDQNAAFQFLTIGFPIGERTLLKDINIQLPCTMNIFDGPKKEVIHYWDTPKRQKSISLKESIEIIAQSMEAFAYRIYDRSKEKFALGLTGGHDSRVILNALTYKDIPFEPIRFDEGNFNDKVSRKLCSILKKPLKVVKRITDNEYAEIQKVVFVYSDGLQLYPYGFTYLAKECLKQQISCIMLGFPGDRISGRTTFPSPQYLKSIEQLAKTALNYEIEWLSFEQARLLINNTTSDIICETESEWIQTFLNEGSQEYLLDISIWQNTRNHKKVRFEMVPSLQYCQIIFPYLDNKVLDAYFSLPAKHLINQKAHCYAGFYRFKELGNFQACGYPIPLKMEALFPFSVYILRSFNLKFKNLVLKRRSSVYKGNWSEKHINIYNEISNCPLFNPTFLKELFFGKKIKKPLDLYKIHTLKRFYDFYICGNKP